MQLDIRIPIGLLFTILGLVIGVYGAITYGDKALYGRSLGTNLNLWSGLCLVAFGLLMLLPAVLKKKPGRTDGGAGKPEEAIRS